MQAGRYTHFLLLLPGAGFILLFLTATVGMTFLQSIGLYSLVGESHLTGEFWLSLLDRTFFDSFLQSRFGVDESLSSVTHSHLPQDLGACHVQGS
jgi:hypothetical protein